MRGRENTVQDFWDRTTVAGEDECWFWTGGVFPKTGYGQFPFGGTSWLAHRFSYQLAGHKLLPIPLHHKCENPLCVNPAHLEHKTRADHIRLHNPKPTHCLRGHEYTPENTYVSKAGSWSCLTCRKARALAKPRKTKEGYCRNGHLRTPENTYRRKDGRTECRLCAQAVEKRRKR